MQLTQLTRFTTCPAILVCAVTLACGAGDSDDRASADTAMDDTVAMSEGTGTVSTPPASDQPRERAITVGDIDRWQRGMEGELAAVREAGQKLKSAKTGNDSVSAIFETNEMSTRSAGARAAGVDEDHYGTINSSLSALVAAMSPIEQEMDVSQMPAEVVAQFKAQRDSGLARLTGNYDPSVVEAIRPRAAALRKQVLELVAARLQAAGMARQ